jgi:uncharacterized protein (TIGR02246 family)
MRCVLAALLLVVAARGADDAQAEAEIRKLITEQSTKKWNEHDPAALRAAHAKDYDKINAFGGWVGSAEADERLMMRLPAGPLKEQTRKVIIERVRLIRPDVALAIVRITDIKQAGKPTGQEARSMTIYVKENGQWVPTAFQNTVINPPPAPVREAEGKGVIY